MNRPTQVDVAQRAGVSRATVSYVLNGLTAGRVPISDETRQRVLEAIEALGYEPDARAQALRSGSTNTIGLIIPDLNNPHFCEYASGVEDAARTAGYHILLSSTSLNEKNAVNIFKDLARRRFDGLIITNSLILESVEAQATLEQIRKRGLPVVEVGDCYGVDAIFADYRQVTKEVVAYLLSLGHRRLGFVYGVGSHELGLDRLEPFQEQLAAAAACEPELIVECGPTMEEGYRAARQLLASPNRPTAILVINDLLAISAMRAAADLGLRVPADLSVVGYDDIPIASFLVPRLTSVSKDAYSSGRKSFEILQARMDNPDLPRQVLRLPAKLIVRESTGPAPA